MPVEFVVHPTVEVSTNPVFILNTLFNRQRAIYFTPNEDFLFTGRTLFSAIIWEQRNKKNERVIKKSAGFR